MRTSNKRVIEHLICAGAFDTLPGNRHQKSEELAHIIDLAITHKKDSLTGQMGLFSGPKKEPESDFYDLPAPRLG